jgi:hypothetical protein
MTDRVETFIQDALKDIGVPVSQSPGDASAETWITWRTVSGRELTASDVGTRVRHMFQVYAHTRGTASEHREVFFRAIEALKAAGVRVFAWGPDERDPDTGISHIVCTCTWNQKN